MNSHKTFQEGERKKKKRRVRVYKLVTKRRITIGKLIVSSLFVHARKANQLFVALAANPLFIRERDINVYRTPFFEARGGTQKRSRARAANELLSLSFFFF